MADKTNSSLAFAFLSLAFLLSGMSAEARTKSTPDFFATPDIKQAEIPQYKSSSATPPVISQFGVEEGEMPRQDTFRDLPSLLDPQRKDINRHFDEVRKLLQPLNEQINLLAKRQRELKSPPSAKPLVASTSGVLSPTNGSPAATGVSATGTNELAARTNGLASGTNRPASETNGSASGTNRSVKNPKVPESAQSGGDGKHSQTAMQEAPGAMQEMQSSDSMQASSVSMQSSGASAHDAAPPSAPSRYGVVPELSAESIASLSSLSDVTQRLDSLKQKRKEITHRFSQHLSTILTAQQMSDFESMRKGTLMVGSGAPDSVTSQSEKSGSR